MDRDGVQPRTRAAAPGETHGRVGSLLRFAGGGHPPVLAPAVEIDASDLEDATSSRPTDQMNDAVGEVLEEAALSIPEEEEESSLAWKGAMLFVTVAWATNSRGLPTRVLSLERVPFWVRPEAAAVFVVLRSVAAAALSTLPWLVPRPSRKRRWQARKSVFCTLSVMVPKRRRWPTAFRRRTRRSSVPYSARQ